MRVETNGSLQIASQRRSALSRSPILPLGLLLLASLCSPATMAERPEEEFMNIRIVIGSESVEGVLYDNATARDFASRLPLSIELEDYASKEKVHTFPEKLSLEGAPAGSKGMSGDITYYSPWGNLAIFYKDHGYASGLVPLGRLNDPGKLARLCSTSCQVRIESM